MMYFLLLSELFVAFPSRNDAIFENNKDKPIKVESSGSLGLYYSGKCHQTFPNETVILNREMDWRSNIVEQNSNQKPWIQYSIPGKMMKLTSFSIRNGCCYHSCCCSDTGEIMEYGCCCLLYSFTLSGSNDNKTWVTLSSQKQVQDFWGCKFMTWDVEIKQNPFRFIRLTEDEPYPKCPFCMQINQVEFYGELLNDAMSYYESDDDSNEESVSIIGKVRKNID